MFCSLPSLARLAIASVLSLLVSVSVPLAASAAEADSDDSSTASKWLDPGEWRPSLGIAFGVAYRNVSGSVDGAFRTSGTAASDGQGVFVVNTDDTDLWPNTELSIDLSGPTIPLDFQLLTPELPLPAKPKLFLDAGYIFNLHKTKVAGSAGLEEQDFDLPGEVQGRAENEVDQQNSWYLGLGASFELPIESYDARVGVSVRYHRDTIRVNRRMLINDPNMAASTDGVWKSIDSVDVDLHEVMPGISLDLDLDKRGPIMIGVYLNTFIGIPIGDEPTSATVVNTFPPLASQPDAGSMDYEFTTGSNLRYSGSIGLRFTWVGE